MSVLKSTEKVKKIFELQAACLLYDIVNADENYLYYPTEIENQLNVVIIYDSETFSRDGVNLQANIFYPVLKRDLFCTRFDKWKNWKMSEWNSCNGRCILF